jgi:hypothetical protein
MGRTVYETNDPSLAAIAFAESEFFTKYINESHPLHSLKIQEAGVFLGDTENENWKIVHKFLPYQVVSRQRIKGPGPVRDRCYC